MVKGCNFNQKVLKEENKRSEDTESKADEEESKKSEVKIINTAGKKGRIEIINYSKGDFGMLIPDFIRISKNQKEEEIIEKIETSAIEEKYLCNGALLKCSKGAAPSKMVVIPKNGYFINEQPVAVVSDMKPMVNILSFGACQRENTPPCTPVISAPWSNPVKGSLINGEATASEKGKLKCNFGGEITVIDAGQSGAGGYKTLGAKSSDEEDSKENKSSESTILDEEIVVKRKSYLK